MEKPEEKLLSRHFSHEHPLERVGSCPRGNTICFGCKLNILSENDYYSCKTCSFCLHLVCYNMPKKVQHPADPNHHFTLQAMPPSTKTSFKCKACGHTVTGFYYYCSKCDDYYHILCLAVPLSVKTHSHPHKLKLEFSPPYDFQCDLCDKACYSGWLYRCGLCEFDAHLGCAFTNKGEQLLLHQSVPLPMPNSSNNKGHELMELLARGVKGIEESNGPEVVQDHESQITDQSNILLSEDMTIPTPSYQFSDACFSIDFAESIFGDDQMYHTSLEVGHLEMKAIVKVKETRTGNYTILSNGIMGDSDQAKQGINHVNNLSVDLRGKGLNNGSSTRISNGIAAHVWMELGKENEQRKTDTTDRTTKTDIVNMKGSCWSKLLQCFN